MRCEVCRALVCAGFTHSRSYCLNGTLGGRGGTGHTCAGRMPGTRAGPGTASESVPAAGFAPDVTPPVTR